MNTNIVQMEGVSKRYGSQQVLQDLKWDIPAGKVIGLLGRNGAGKSTLMECLLGLRETDSGSLSLFGEAVNQLSDGTRARIGYVPQKPDLFEWLTPPQMLDYFKALYPRWNTAKVQALLQRWGFNPLMQNKPIGKMSVGEKQRLSIIRALAHDPELLILDEPVSSLDPAGRRDFLRELISEVIERETTVVFSTHILSDLERIAMDVAFLKDGKIGLQSPLDDLMESAKRITGPTPAFRYLNIKGEVSRAQNANGQTSIIACTDAADIATLHAQTSVHIEPISLEDLFVEVTQ
ncbi:ABC transporter ATP-binding protein [Undibacterium terreum]|uniref:ABC transporter n=1 Tax=Undibacterium terreum TaxID=1224302 RepID=A0A916UDY6_9BURK|nr:ABC transporter ATP-binding protein [Undibacterium terreum]GGC67504.1 ABC transporter [Undibacterium terreum]